MTKPNHIGLTVTNLDASTAFYRDVVGMELERRYPITDDAWFKTLTENPAAVVEAVMLHLGAIRLQLVQYHRGGEPGGTGHAALGGLHLCFEVDDVDAVHTAISTDGRYHLGPIVRREPYGGRSFYVHDPDGVPVELEHGRVRRILLGIMIASAVIVGLCLILVAVTLGRCDAFGGRCPADEPPLLDDDVFGIAAFGGLLVVAVPYFLYRPSMRRLLTSVPVGVAAGLIVGLIARSSVR